MARTRKEFSVFDMLVTKYLACRTLIARTVKDEAAIVEAIRADPAMSAKFDAMFHVEQQEDLLTSIRQPAEQSANITAKKGNKQ